jgi:hypothetical protein
MLKEMGIAYVFEEKGSKDSRIRPRIIIQSPRPGYIHPFGKADILRILDFIGAEALYGLRSIELRQQRATTACGLPPFGQLIVPGRIKVYEQPIPPWRFPGALPESETEYMRRAGAKVDINQEIKATFVHWPKDSFRNFMIFEVLVHEIGHHILQHNAGKRTQRIARTRDHEAFARRFSDRYRAAWFAERAID